MRAAVNVTTSTGLIRMAYLFLGLNVVVLVSEVVLKLGDMAVLI